MDKTGRSFILTLMASVFLSVVGREPAEVKPPSGDATSLVDALRQVFEKEQEGFRNCPPPYTHILGECFYIHMYVPLLTWKEAQTFCKQAGGILAEPKFFGAVIAHMYNIGMAEKIFGGIINRLWVGGERVGTNSTSFKWSASGRPINDPVSEEGLHIFPDGPGDCVMLTVYKDTPVQLRAKDCDIATHYLCQLL